MTPKEKAGELVDKIYQTTPNEAWINEPLGIVKEYKAYNQSKECALIAVDEILEALGYKSLSDSPYTTLEARQYYVQVKQEIENL